MKAVRLTTQGVGLVSGNKKLWGFFRPSRSRLGLCGGELTPISFIVRARQQHLLGLYKQKRLDATLDVTETRLAALEAYLTKNLPRIPEKTSPENVESEITNRYSAVLSGHPLDPGTVPGDKEAKVKMHIKTARGAATAISSLEKGKIVSEEHLDDVVMPWLDQKFGASVAEKSIFLELTKNFEKRFEQDMENLNCLAPDIVTRVSEYATQM